MAKYGTSKYGIGDYGAGADVPVRSDQRIPAVYSQEGAGEEWSNPAGLATGISTASCTLEEAATSKSLIGLMNYQRFICTDAAAILGIKVDITLTCDKPNLMPIVSASFDETTTPPPLVEGRQVLSLGGPFTNPFGGTPTAADYNSPDFGITLQVFNPGLTTAVIIVERIAITLWYQEDNMTFVHEPEVAFGKMQIGSESTWGTIAAVDTALGSVIGRITPKMQEVLFTPQGVVVPTVQAVVRQWCEIALEGKVCFEEIGYFLTSLVSNEQSDPASKTVEIAGLKCAGAVMSGIGISVAKEGDWSLKGSMKAKRHECEESGVPLVAAVTADLVIPTLTPVIGTGTTLKFGTSTPSTTVSKWWEFNLNIPSLWDLVFYQGDVTARTVKQLQAVPTFDFSVEADAVGLAMILPNTTYVWELKQTTGDKSITLTWQGRLSEPSELSNMDGLYGYSWKGTVTHQATAIGVAVDLGGS
jgi:hypothetical protein